MKSKEIIFSIDKERREWVGQLDNLTFRFRDYKAGDVYATMLETYPDVKVGFKSIDLGAATFLAYGPVMWMKLASEQK